MPSTMEEAVARWEERLLLESGLLMKWQLLLMDLCSAGDRSRSATAAASMGAWDGLCGLLLYEEGRLVLCPGVDSSDREALYSTLLALSAQAPEGHVFRMLALGSEMDSKT
jgi:hypothetical protein